MEVHAAGTGDVFGKQANKTRHITHAWTNIARCNK
jgi:hypothetical protein